MGFAAVKRALLLTLVVVALWPPSASAGSRIYYASDWSGAMEIYAVDPAGKAPPAQITFGGDVGPCAAHWTPCGFVGPVPSPDGRDLLYRNTDGSLWLARADGRSARQLTTSQRRADWSPDSRYLAYSQGGGIHVVRADGTHDRLVLPAVDGDVIWSANGQTLYVRSNGDLSRFRAGQLKLLTLNVAGDLVPSPDRRWLMTIMPGRTGLLLDLRARPVRRLPLIDKAVAAAWSPDSTRLAVISPDGLSSYDVRTNRTRLLARAADVRYRYEQAIGAAALGLAWSPDGRSLAYIPGGTNPEIWGGIESGNLRVVSVSGHLRTVVSTEHAYGGRMLSIAWARTARGLRYRVPEETTTGRASVESVLTNGHVWRLASDGERIAFAACNDVYVWTPGRSDVTDVTKSDPSSACFYRTNYAIYGMAVSGDRVAYTESSGCNIITQALNFKRLDASAAPRSIAIGSGNCGGPYHPFVDNLQGDHDLLVFTSGNERWDGAHFFTTDQTIERIESDGCPCTELSSSGGPLISADVDAGRIVAFGEKATLVLDRDGNVLLSIPVAPTAAQLSGNDLVVLLRGQLRDYDARNGTLLHTWSLPDVPSGRGCWIRCADDRLVLQDAANGLGAYVIDGEVHLLRLADGADKTFVPGTLARFTKTGLVYVRGSRLRITPFAALPLRGF
jgi:dipeptidyl aminopeptidase/acylaminoacyl peptidase